MNFVIEDQELIIILKLGIIKGVLIIATTIFVGLLSSITLPHSVRVAPIEHAGSNELDLRHVDLELELHESLKGIPKDKNDFKRALEKMS